MMDASHLAAAIDAHRDAQAALDALHVRAGELEPQLSAAKKEVAESRKAFDDAHALEILGESTPEATAPLRAARDSARDRLDGLTRAAQLLGDRITAAAQHLRERKAAAELAAKPYAADLAATELANARVLATMFAESLSKWQDFNSVAVGGRLTGRTQQNAHGCVERLAEMGVNVQHIAIGHSMGTEPLMTPEQILAAITSRDTERPDAAQTEELPGVAIG